MSDVTMGTDSALAVLTPAQEQTDLALKANSLPGFLGISDLDAGQLARAQQFAASLNTGDQVYLSKVGSDLQNSVKQASDNILAQTRTSKAGDAGKALMSFMNEIEGIDVGSVQGFVNQVLSKVPFAKDVYDEVKGIVDGLEPVVEKIDRAEIELKKYSMDMQEGVQRLDTMQSQTGAFISEMKVVIVGLKIRQQQEIQKLNELQAQLAGGTGGDPMELGDKIEAQQNIVNLLDIRIGNLEQIRIIGIQTRMTAKTIQKGDMQLSVGLSDQVMTASTIWKLQMAAAIELLRQQQALKAYTAGVDTTSRMQEKLAETLGQQSVAVAQATNAGIIQMDSLVKAQENIKKAVTDVMAINEQGRKDRDEREQQMNKMESEMATIFSTFQSAA